MIFRMTGRIDDEAELTAPRIFVARYKEAAPMFSQLSVATDDATTSVMPWC